MSTCNRLDLEWLGSWPIMPKNFPGTGKNVWRREKVSVHGGNKLEGKEIKQAAGFA